MNGRVVSNTGPLIAFAMIERLDLLRSLFNEVVVPNDVHQEILQGGPHDAGLASYVESSWIQRRALVGPLDPLLQSILDVGEASVIQLAREAAADYVLIDERRARKIARDVYALEVVGSAGILVEAKRRRLIESVGAELNRMRDSGYWIHERIVAAARRRAGET